MKKYDIIKSIKAVVFELQEDPYLRYTELLAENLKKIFLRRNKKMIFDKEKFDAFLASKEARLAELNAAADHRLADLQNERDARINERLNALRPEITEAVNGELQAEAFEPYAEEISVLEYDINLAKSFLTEPVEEPVAEHVEETHDETAEV